MDETIVNFIDPVADMVSKDGITLDRGSMKSYNFSDYGINKSVWDREGFFLNLEPFPNALRVLDGLSSDHDIVIATDNGGSSIIKKDKEIFIEKHLSFVSDVFFTGEKHSIKGDLIFDDCPKHLLEFKGIKVKMDRPYNQDIMADYVIYNNNWLVFENLVGYLARGYLNE